MMSATRGYRCLIQTPIPMGMSVLHRVRMIAPKGNRFTTGVLIHARLYIQRHSGMSTSARIVEEMVMTMLHDKHTTNITKENQARCIQISCYAYFLFLFTLFVILSTSYIITFDDLSYIFCHYVILTK